jgi:hypothetical protein
MSRSSFSPSLPRLGGAWLASLASLALAASACAPEDTVAPAPSPEAIAPSHTATLEDGDVFVRDGMLVFASEDAFERVFGELQNQDRVLADEWERRLGFVSQRQLFDRLVDAEYAYLVAPYEKLSDEELAKMEPPVGHTDMYAELLERGLIRETVIEGEPTYDYNLPTPSMARVLNAEGFVAIGDRVYQVKGDGMREAKGVVSSPVAAESQSLVKSFGVVNKVDGWKTINNRRGYLQVQMVPTYYNPWPHKKVQIKYEVNVKSQRKNFWGNWVYASCPNEVWISGSWTLALDYMILPYLSYWYSDYYSRSYSYPYHPNCINNFYGSINPTSGTTIPYPGVTVITIYSSNRAFSDVRVTPMNWQASVPGGSNGIHLQVTN